MSRVVDLDGTVVLRGVDESTLVTCPGRAPTFRIKTRHTVHSMSAHGQQAAAAKPVKATMEDLERMLSESPSPERVCQKLAMILRVRRNEVALLRLEKNNLRFVFPPELRAAGALPLSSPAVAARTAATRTSLLSNSFARVRHVSLFESVKLGSDEDESFQQMPIQKIMSVPLASSDRKVLGVVQLSRKGLDASLAGPDFTREDLKQLEQAAAILARMSFMQVGAEI